jgi:hypothetical protein
MFKFSSLLPITPVLFGGEIILANEHYNAKFYHHQIANCTTAQAHAHSPATCIW